MPLQEVTLKTAIKTYSITLLLINILQQLLENSHKCDIQAIIKTCG